MSTCEQSPQWSNNFQDPPTTQGLKLYEELGVQRKTPHMHRESGGDLDQTTAACSDLLEKVYDGNYPLDVNAANVLKEEIENNTTHLFTLEDEQGIKAMSALVEKQNPLGGTLRFAELGRSCKDPETSLSVCALLRSRIGWGQEHLQQDFYNSITRTAADRPNMPGGRGVQGVWWGSRRKNANLPLITTTIGYDYQLGNPEPFNGFAIPANPEKWAADVNQFHLYIPSEEDKQVFETLFTEATYGAACPQLHVTAENSETARFATLQAGSEVAGAQYVTNGQGQVTETEIDTEYRGGMFSQKVVIEAAEASTPRGATTMQQLYNQGWSLAGWQPSYIVPGGVCPVLTRLHPDVADRAVSAKLHPANFDEVGLGGTRKVIEKMYSTIHTKVGSAAIELSALSA